MGTYIVPMELNARMTDRWPCAKGPIKFLLLVRQLNSDATNAIK